MVAAKRWPLAKKMSQKFIASGLNLLDRQSSIAYLYGMALE
jgi:hypothetical protein